MTEATCGNNNADCDHGDKKHQDQRYDCVYENDAGFNDNDDRKERRRWRGRTAVTLSWTAAVTAKHSSSVMRALGSNAQCLTSPWGKGKQQHRREPTDQNQNMQWFHVCTGLLTRILTISVQTYWLCQYDARAMCMHARVQMHVCPEWMHNVLDYARSLSLSLAFSRSIMYFQMH